MAISKQKRYLKPEILEGAKAPEKVLRDMWALRLDYLELKISKEEDWQKFSQILRKENTLLINFRDEQGTLQGYFTFSFNPVDHDGQKALLVHSKYYYVRTVYRGHPKITGTAWKLWPGMIWRYGFRQLYFVAFSFPTSYVSLSRTFGRVLTIQHPNTSNWEKHILEQFVQDQCEDDWDSEQKLIRNQNVPFGEDRPASENVQALRDDYLATNPLWAQGISLPIMMKFDLATIKSVIQNNLRRLRRA